MLRNLNCYDLFFYYKDVKMLFYLLKRRKGCQTCSGVDISRE